MKPPASGKFVVRIPPKLHEKIRARAGASGISLNEMCQLLLVVGLEGGASLSPFEAQLIAKASSEFGSSLVGLLFFGSYARKETHDSSDIDLLVVLESSVPLRRELYRRWEELPGSKLDEKVSVHFSHLPVSAEDAGSLWLECALDGKIVSDPTLRLERALREIRRRIVSGKVVRRETHGQGYWVET